MVSPSRMGDGGFCAWNEVVRRHPGGAAVGGGLHWRRAALVPFCEGAKFRNASSEENGKNGMVSPSRMGDGSFCAQRGVVRRHPGGPAEGIGGAWSWFRFVGALVLGMTLVLALRTKGILHFPSALRLLPASRPSNL